jgi:hypothetical protein
MQIISSGFRITPQNIDFIIPIRNEQQLMAMKESHGTGDIWE